MNEYKRLTEKVKDCFQYDLKDFKHKIGEFGDYDTFFAYSMAIKRLGELEEKIENGTLVELPRIIHPNEQEWFVQYQYKSGIIDCNVFYSEAEAEAKLKELREKEECR